MMVHRPREEITRQVVFPPQSGDERYAAATLEVLLDIRDQLDALLAQGAK